MARAQEGSTGVLPDAGIRCGSPGLCSLEGGGEGGLPWPCAHRLCVRRAGYEAGVGSIGAEGQPLPLPRVLCSGEAFVISFSWCAWGLDPVPSGSGLEGDVAWLLLALLASRGGWDGVPLGEMWTRKGR